MLYGLYLIKKNCTSPAGEERPNFSFCPFYVAVPGQVQIEELSVPWSSIYWATTDSNLNPDSDDLVQLDDLSQ